MLFLGHRIRKGERRHTRARVYVCMYVSIYSRTCICSVLCVLLVETTDYYRMVMINGPVSELPFYKTDPMTLS